MTLSPSEPGRLFDADVSAVPAIRRITTRERALLFHREAHKHGVSADVKEAIAERLRTLQQQDYELE
ncbi:hypothetical protein HSTV1_47 [Haloarcula sinaiiensis tailed virus 1]|uniref:Uncharacterized protein n=1 Tax=Haloarcula sinaiiensis tailed virus 1 TaxID=1262530 RepID=R9QSP9_9CAUD|nr:hypothetical protein HSTV1_47 [Haloarcula sinaiiensis tailed virus 1]AGC34592.1 hypothetical protein HSTV1_47 [Haloarcula sinaiiensis tailed virus 1]